MRGKKKEEIGITMNKMLKEIRKDFSKCYLAKNLAKGRFGKFLQ
jgi:hypothetical protein